MCSVLSISSYEVGRDESYLQFYGRLLRHQVDNLLPAGTRVADYELSKDDVLTKSHQMLLCVLWLEKIDPRLPSLVQAQYSQQLKSGVNIIDLVPVLAEQVDSLLGKQENRIILHQQEIIVHHQEIIGDQQEEGGGVKEETGEADSEISIDIDFERSSGQDADHKNVKLFADSIKDDNEEDRYEEEWNGFQDEEGVDPDPGDRIQQGEDTPDNKLNLQHFINSDRSQDQNFKKVRKKVRKRKEKIKNEEDSNLQSKGSKTDQTFYCDDCPQFSTNYTNKYRLHMKEIHGKFVKFCKECDAFVDGDAKTPHSKHMKDIKCSECDTVLKTLRLFNVHQFKVHNIGTAIQCELCPYNTAIKAYFNAHMRTTHGEGFICVECGEKFTHKSAYKCHIKFKHEGVKEICDQCDFVSTTRDGLSYHVKTVHLGLKSVICKVCGVKLNRQRELRTHMATIHGSGKYWSCTKCDYNATTKQLLQEHDRKVHELIFFSCDKCPSKFVRKYALRRHMENVHKIFGVKVE